MYVIEIRVPPLRERKDDLPLLIEHFLAQYRRKQQRLQAESSHVPTTLPGQILEALYAYDWPGNVRELQNVLQRYLATQHLGAEMPLIPPLSQGTRAVPDITLGLEDTTLPEMVRMFEKRMIADALVKNDHRKINTARMLGIPRSTLHRKLKEYGLREYE